MIRVHFRNENQVFTKLFGDVPLEFGRSKNMQTDDSVGKKVVVQDKFASRHHARLEKKGSGWALLTNLSDKKPIRLSDKEEIAPGDSREFAQPIICFWVGKTLFEVGLELKTQEGLETISPNNSESDDFESLIRKLGGIETPNMDLLLQWFETIIGVQRAAAGKNQFAQQAAEAIVNLVGFEHAKVLSLEDSDWKSKGEFPENSDVPSFSRSLLQQVLTSRQTCYRSGDSHQSINDGMLAAASPIFDSDSDKILGAVYGCLRIDVSKNQTEITPLMAKLLQTLAGVMSLGIVKEQHEKEASNLRDKFEQFFTPKLARELENNPKLLEGTEREITVLFGDLRDFTKHATSLSPIDTCRAITDVLECMTEAVRSTDGVVIDYAGDGILAIWNAPTNQENHVELAATSALRIIEDLPDVSQNWQQQLGNPFQVGIGIHTGVALVGNTGTKYKFKYGASGHTVNLASRIESATKHIGVPILVSESAQKRLGSEFQTRRLPRLRAPGISEPFRVFELNNGESDDWPKRRDIYELALSQFEDRQWAQACQTIQPLLFSEDIVSGDAPSLMIASRSIEYLSSPPDDFDAVVTLKNK